MRARLLLLAAATAFAPGCWGDHERVDVERCAPPGTHPVTQRVVSSECGPVGSEPFAVTIPPEVDDFSSLGGAEVVMVHPCRWEVHVDESVPELSVQLDGWIDTSDGTVRAAFDAVIVGLTGMPCRTRFEWTEDE